MSEGWMSSLATPIPPILQYSITPGSGHFIIASWDEYHCRRSLMPIIKGTAKNPPTPRTTPDHPMASKKNPAMVIPIHPPA